MKYLKFYEAFKSKGISNTIKFLKDKVGSHSSTSFAYALKDFMDNIDFPIDKISDDDIKYLSAKKALKLQKEKPVTNQRGIWVIKYWFSLKEGYLGYSATGNETREIQNNGSGGHPGLRDQRQFTDPEMVYIKDNITRTGEIWPVSDYKKLKTGDTVIGLFDGSSYPDKISFAKIFIDESDNNRTYAVQNVSDGSTPTSSEWRSYREYGNLTWWLYDTSELGNDHSKLYYWRQSEDELHYIEPPVEEIKTKDEEREVVEVDPLTYNLPLSNRYAFSYWGRGSSISKTNIEKADFALVLYFDDLVNPESDAIHYERPSDTREVRRKEKEGSTKLMSDEEIKKMNIERYVKGISSSLNITETEFSDLSKIVTKHLAREFSYLSLWIGSPNYANISEFSESLYNIIDSSDVDKKYWVDRTKKLYENQVKSYYDRLLKYQESKKLLKGDSFLKKIFDDILKLGEVIFRYFSELKIETIDELWLVRQKFNTLVNYIKMSRNQLSYRVRETFNGFRYPEEMSYYFDQYRDSYSEADYKLDLEKLQRMTTFIKSL